jgi:hypothetical protein
MKGHFQKLEAGIEINSYWKYIIFSQIMNCTLFSHKFNTTGEYRVFPWGKAAGREADHSPPSSAEVKNVWSYTSTPPIHLHGEVLS